MSSPLFSRWKAFRLKTLCAAVLSSIAVCNAHAVGLGDLTVQSALGQPLRAEIELVSTAKTDEGPVRVKLASYEAYRQANIEFNVALMSLRFSVEQRGDRQVVRVWSAQPINEPFIDMLLELGSGGGRMVREYVFLLDPASLPLPQATASVPNNSVAPKASPSQPAQAAVATAAAANPAKPAEKLPPAHAPAKPPAATLAQPKPMAVQEHAGKPAALNNGGKSRLKLSAVSAVAGPNGDAAINREDYASMEKALSDANARVKALEVKVGELQKLLEVTNALLAELQKQNALTKAGMKTDAKAELKADAPAPVVASAAPATAETAPAAAKSETPAVAPVKPAPAVAKPAPRPKPVAPPPPEPSLLDDPLVLPGAGMLLVLVGALGLYRRRRKAQQPFDADSFSNEKPDSHENSNTEGMASGTLNSSWSLLGNPSHSGEVDAMSEADVYIAYGRDVQAEEVLKDALAKQPERHALRVKLLGIFAGRKDVQAYESLARELYRMTKGEGDDWAHAAAMGLEIDPNNPLYAQNKTSAPKPRPEIIMAVPDLADDSEDEDDEEGALATALTGEAVTMASDAVAADTTPLPGIPAVEELPSSAPEPSANDLDFDLDALRIDETTPSALAAAAEKQQPEPGPIDFDFLVPAIPAAAAEEKPEEPPADLPKPGTGPIDFDFILPSIPVAEEPAAAETQAQAATGPIDFDFVLPTIPTVGEAEDDGEPARATK